MTPATRAIICTGHLMLLQNPRAHLRVADQGAYFALVRDWCLRQQIDNIFIYHDAPELGQCSTTH